MLGTSELLVIALVVLILFGAAALPKFAKSLGRAKKEFQKGLNEEEGEDNEADKKTKD